MIYFVPLIGIWAMLGAVVYSVAATGKCVADAIDRNTQALEALKRAGEKEKS